MAAAVLVRGGTRVHWVNPGAGVERSVRISPDVDSTAGLLANAFSSGLPVALRAALSSSPPRACVDPALSAAIARMALPLAVLSLVELRAARESAPPTPREEDRALALALARRALDSALQSPEETLISLAREEERVERAIRREAGAAEQFLVGTESPLSGYVAEWVKFRSRFDEHHAKLLDQLEASAREVAPNLSAVVGPRVAARLIAHAPGLATLARMSASRLQLLGSRRRPSTSRGPRFGLIYRAERMSEVPPDRAGAYARSLAALAAIAARADGSTRAAIGPGLTARRDRRIERLRRGGR